MVKIKRIEEDIRKRTIEGTRSTIELSNVKKKGRKYFKFGFWGRRNLKKKPEHSFIVTMLFANGTNKTFIITTDKLTFEHKKKTYFLYYEESYFNISLNGFHIYYHEHFPVPINREIQKIGDEAYFAITPESLKDIIEMKYIEALSGSGGMAKWVKVLIILSACTLVAVIIVLFQVWGAVQG